MRTKRKVAKDLGVDEEKVQELIDGTRHIGGETMDKVLESINDEKENAEIRDLEILDWYMNTDLKKLRKEWGYGQTELGDRLGIYSKTLNAVESKYQFRGHVSNNMRKLYDFYQNEFNKKLEPLQDKARVRVNKLNDSDTNIQEEKTPNPTIEPIKANIVFDDISKANIIPQFVDEDIIIKIDKDGNITYSEYGKEILNITELHLDKVGDEKPTLDIKLRRLF